MECRKERCFLISFVVLQERIPVEEVFEQLKCTKEGLSSEEGANRLQIFGPNKLEEKKVPFLYDTLTNIANISKCSQLLMQLLIGINNTGQQNSQVSWVHVESFVMGHGSCGFDGNWSCKW